MAAVLQIEIAKDVLAHVNDMPTVREELERKTYETLNHLSDRFLAGYISEADVSFGCDIIWMVASGLVGDDLAKAITTSVSTESKQERRIFADESDNITLTVKRVMGEDTFTILKRRGSAIIEGKAIQCGTPKQAKEKMEALCARLVNRGMDEL